ncbi:MAG: two-component sensor histidine kinase, partial [Runella sp.]
MHKIIRHIFLLLALVSLSAAFLSFFFLERGALGASEEKYLEGVKSRVKNELEISQNELRSIVAILAQNTTTTFSDLRRPTKYPYYVFKNGELIFWSDHRFVPDYESIRQLTQTRLVGFEQGKYLVSKQPFSNFQDNFEVVSLINLYQFYKKENNYLQSGYNAELFSIDPEEISATPKVKTRNVLDNQFNFLFSITPPKFETYRNLTTPVNTIIWGVLSVIFLGIYVFQWVYRWSHQKHFERAFLLLTVYLLLLRVGMLYFGIPFLFSENDLFNPKFYVASPIAPSLGDLLLNCLVCFVLSLYLADFYFRSKTYTWLLNLPQQLKVVLSVVWVVLSSWVFYGAFSELKNIYEKSQFTLDITLSISFSGLKVVAICIFVLISSIYFLNVHLLASLFIRFNQNRWQGLGLFLVGLLVSGLSFWMVGVEWHWIYGVHIVYFLVLYFSRFPRILYTFRYRTTIYYFTGAFFWALVTTYVVYTEEEQKDITQKKIFGQQMIAQNDGFGEFLLDNARKTITQDADIRLTIVSDTDLS